MDVPDPCLMLLRSPQSRSTYVIDVTLVWYAAAKHAEVDKSAYDANESLQEKQRSRWQPF